MRHRPPLSPLPLLLLILFTVILNPVAAQDPTTRTSAKFIFGRDVTYVRGAVSSTPAGPIHLPTTTYGAKPWWFRSLLTGSEFTVYMRMEPGQYDLRMGFRAPQPCDQGVNVFSVRANGRPALTDYDLSRACNPVRIETTTATVTKASGIISLKFTASKGLAHVAFITVDLASSETVPSTMVPPITGTQVQGTGPGGCMPQEGNSAITRDPQINHMAHAVPGSYPAAVDRAGKGFARVFINGDGSHTHFSTSEGSGYIVSYLWENVNTNKVISTKESFYYDFPLGSTKLKLTVIDSACTTHSAFTDIVVTGNLQPGAYCYYYRDSSAWPQVGMVGLLKWPRPAYAHVVRTAVLDFDTLTANDPQFPLKDRPFAVRCLFYVDHGKLPDRTDDDGLPVDTLAVYTRESGVARLYRDDKMVLDTTQGFQVRDETVSGIASYELLFRHTDGAKHAFAALWANGVRPAFTHDQAEVLPILRNIDPPSASAGGGARLRLSGHGLYRPLTVWFGGNLLSAQAERVGASATQVFVIVPQAANGLLEGAVKVSVASSENKRSNSVDVTFFKTGATTCDDVSFSAHDMLTTGGNQVPLNQPTSAAIGPDGKLYVGTRGGAVQAIEYDHESLVMTSICHSEVLSESDVKRGNGKPSPRTILGVTFDPRDAVPRPYVATSTMFWGRFNLIDPKNEGRWANGAVIRLKPATAATRQKDQQQCLQRDIAVVKNLPVADGDHSVNEMTFTQGGDLLIAVGGQTNNGLPGGKLGGLWESYFSASIVIARLSRGANFNGVIPYTNIGNSRLARPKAGYTDVALYATGVRNLFSMGMTRSGRIFGVDMGPNCEYGNVSTSCNEYNEAYAASRQRITSLPGRVIVDPNATPAECKWGPGRGDKLIRILPNKFYGHSNLQRDRPGECAWIDPRTDKSPKWNVPTPASYQKPLAVIPSAKTGFVEYGSNLFCGHVRGDLILSKNSEKGTWRARMNDNGKLIGKPFQFLGKGGIRVVENVHGSLLFPRYFGSGVFVNKAVTGQSNGGWHVVNALPWRHGRNGGTRVTIGGWGFADKDEVRVSIGGAACTAVQVNAKGTEVSCRTPSRPGSGQGPYDVTVTQNGASKTLSKAVLYMNV